MPRNVTLFERLMYASLCIGLLNLILDGPRQAAAPELQEVGGSAFFVSVALGTLAILVLFIWLIARRRKNWARYLLAVFFVVGLWPALQNISVLLEAAPLSGVLGIAQMVIQAAALYFIFTGDALAWFEKPATAG